jgi:hypothetical protein
MLHKEWTAWLINQVVKEDPRFAAVKAECEGEVYQMYLDVIREEKAWADYLFNKGPVIGLNAQHSQRLCGLHSVQCTQRNWHQVRRRTPTFNTYSLVYQARGHQQETNCTPGERVN